MDPLEVELSSREFCICRVFGGGCPSHLHAIHTHRDTSEGTPTLVQHRNGMHKPPAVQTGEEIVGYIPSNPLVCLPLILSPHWYTPGRPLLIPLHPSLSTEWYLARMHHFNSASTGIGKTDNNPLAKRTKQTREGLLQNIAKLYLELTR